MPMQPELAGAAAPPAVAGALTADRLAEEHAPVVYRFCAMVCRDAHDAEDLAQEALLRAMRSLDRFDPARGSIEGWLWRIVVNLATDRGRAARRAESLWAGLAVRARAEAAPSAELLALERIRDAQLLAAVRGLPRRQRTLIALRFGADLGFAEIGQLLGDSEQAVKQATYRALASLRRRLEADR